MKKNISILILVILVVCMSVINVYAEDSTPICELQFKKSEKSVAPGETIELTLYVSDIQESGIAGVSGVIEYEENLFEKVEYEETTNWEKPALIDSAIDIFTKSLSNETEDQDVFKMVLTTKEGISEGDYDVKLKNIEITTEDDVYSIDDVETTITIKETTTPSTNTNNTNTSNTNTNTNTNRNTSNTNTNKNQTNTNSNTNKNNAENQSGTIENTSNGNTEKTVKEGTQTQDATTSSGTKSLPKTGLVAGIGIGIIAVAVAALIFYFKYDKYKSVK